MHHHLIVKHKGNASGYTRKVPAQTLGEVGKSVAELPASFYAYCQALT